MLVALTVVADTAMKQKVWNDLKDVAQIPLGYFTGTNVEIVDTVILLLDLGFLHFCIYDIK